VPPVLPGRSIADSTYSEKVHGRRHKRFRSFALPLLLALPLLTLPALGYLALSGNGGEDAPEVALGALGGGFHPVAGSFVADDTELDGCGERKYVCLEQGFGNMAYREGPTAALRLFDQRIVTDADVKADCHRIAHSIGSAAFARFEGDVARTFSGGSSTCASGYYHGVLERAFVGVSSKSELQKVAERLCDAQGIRRRSFLDYQCRHGLGHGLMIQTGYDLPTALSVCSRLGTGWDDLVCTGGVFMENINTRYGFRSQWVRDDDPLYPCRDVRAIYKRSCYMRATARILDLNGRNFPKAARTCAGLASHWSTFCFRGYGRDAVGEARYAPARILSLCRLTRGAQGDCLLGAARTVGDGFGFAGARRAARLCTEAPATARDACFSGVGLVLGLLLQTDVGRLRACEKLALGHVRSCVRAATAEVDPSGRDAWA
jgi:hypothetical protein